MGFGFSCLVASDFVCSDDLSQWERWFLAKPSLKFDWKRLPGGKLQLGFILFHCSSLIFWMFYGLFQWERKGIYFEGERAQNSDFNLIRNSKFEIVNCLRIWFILFYALIDVMISSCQKWDFRISIQ